MYMKLSFLRNFYSCCNVACYRPKTAVSVETCVANEKLKWVKLTRQHESWPSPSELVAHFFCLAISILLVHGIYVHSGKSNWFRLVFAFKCGLCKLLLRLVRNKVTFLHSFKLFRVFFVKVSEMRLINCSLWLYKDRKRQWLRVGQMMRDPSSPDETLGCQISPLHSIELHYLVLSRVVFGWKDRVEG